MNLTAIGWDSAWESAFQPYSGSGFVPGRVWAAQRGLFQVWTTPGEVSAEVSGKLRHSSGLWPVTGDWVALSASGARIEAVLPRRTVFTRKAPGEVTTQQVLAANVDVALIVTALDADFSPRRVERYLEMAYVSGVRPVVVLNKADACENLAGMAAEAEAVAGEAPVVIVSALTGAGLHLVGQHIGDNETAVLLGSSGVGKSTIVNRLRGFESQRTREVRPGDNKGRHTTTHRELIPLDLGWLLMDVPGLRELQLWHEPGEAPALEKSFAEVAALAASCRFGDCRHAGEPGCAVEQAIAAGDLDPARLESYRKLAAESAYLDRRQDEHAALEYKRWNRAVHRAARDLYKRRGR
jgi:ribosome biogenesis GTPase